MGQGKRSGHAGDSHPKSTLNFPRDAVLEGVPEPNPAAPIGASLSFALARQREANPLHPKTVKVLALPCSRGALSPPYRPQIVH